MLDHLKSSSRTGVFKLLPAGQTRPAKPFYLAAKTVCRSLFRTKEIIDFYSEYFHIEFATAMKVKQKSFAFNAP